MIQRLKKLIPFGILGEVTVFAAVAVVLSLLIFPREISNFKVFFNPSVVLLVMITLVVVRYGIGWGLYSAILSCFYFLLLPGFSSVHTETFLFTVAAFFIPPLIFGPVHSRFSNRIMELENELDNSNQSHERLTQEFSIIQFLKDDYEKRILLQTAKLSDFYEDALSMQVLHESALYEKIIQIVRKYMDAEKCSLYIIDNDKLRLKTCAGFNDNDVKPAEIIDKSAEPFKTVLELKEIVSINHDVFRNSSVQFIPVYIGPLKTSYENVIGVINIDSMNFLKFNKTSRKIFASLCDWASKALENAQSYQTCENRRIVRQDTGIFTYQYMKLRLDEAIESTLTTNASFALLVVDIRLWDMIHPKNREPVLKFVSRIIQQNIRDFDILGHFEHESEIAVLMPQVSREQLQATIDRMESQLNKFNLQPYEDGSVLRLQLSGISGFRGAKNFNELVEIVRKPKN